MCHSRVAAFFYLLALYLSHSRVAAFFYLLALYFSTLPGRPHILPKYTMFFPSRPFFPSLIIRVSSCRIDNVSNYIQKPTCQNPYMKHTIFFHSRPFSRIISVPFVVQVLCQVAHRNISFKTMINSDCAESLLPSVTTKWPVISKPSPKS